MIKTFTPDDVIRLLYDEIDSEKKETLSSTLLFDETLEEIYENYKMLLESLDNIAVNPSQKTIDAILTYSKSYPLHS